MNPSIVIVTHRGGALLQRCVEALNNQSVRPSSILVVISSKTNVPTPPGVDTLWLKENVGYATAANTGLEAHKGRPVILLNDDTIPHADFIKALKDASKSPGIYQPRILLAAHPDKIENTGHCILPDGFNIARARGQQRNTELPQSVGAFSGAAVMFTPEVYENLGGFDEQLESFGEDLDLSLRALRHGFLIHYVRDAVVLHELGATYGRTSPQKVHLVERNRIQAATRSLPFTALVTMPIWSALRLGTLGLAAAAGRGIGSGVGAQGMMAIATGNAAGVRYVPRALRKRWIDKHTWQRKDREMWQLLLLHRIRMRDWFPPNWETQSQ